MIVSEEKAKPYVAWQKIQIYEEGCFRTNLHVLAYLTACASLDTTTWLVLGLRMEGWPPAMEDNCEYIE
jgi:hypothetical protein